MAYNWYRKRHYNLSDSKKREYHNDLVELQETMSTHFPDWSVSSRMDSCYKDYKQFTVRLSNHSIDNQYHNIHGGKLYVNIKASKLDFPTVIRIKLPEVLKALQSVDLEKYRLISVNQDRITLFYKNFKTKKTGYSFIEKQR